MVYYCERRCGFWRCYDYCHYEGHDYFEERNHSFTGGGIGGIVFFCLLLLMLLSVCIWYCITMRNRPPPPYYVPADPMFPDGDAVVYYEVIWSNPLESKLICNGNKSKVESISKVLNKSFQILFKIHSTCIRLKFFFMSLLTPTAFSFCLN